MLLDRVPANGESWFVAQCFAKLRAKGILSVLSFSDPVPRYAVGESEPIFKGHIGNVYQALNAVYAGLGTARTLKVLPDGTVLNDRTAQKIRAQERGCESAERMLVRMGAAARRPNEDPAGWLSAWAPRLTRPMRHPGNHRYLFGLDRRVRRHLPKSMPYPKFQAAAT